MPSRGKISGSTPVGAGTDTVSDFNEVYGSAQADRLFGSDAGDFLAGIGGADQIDGRAGNDYLSGGAGPDALKGATGADKLIGSGGNDSLNARLTGNDPDQQIDCGRGASDVGRLDREDPQAARCEQQSRR